MSRQVLSRAAAIVTACTFFASCATMQELVETPRVSLRSVQVQELDLDNQTFLLSFDVTNPNPIALPIDSISYDVRLDGYRFASGETPGSFTIPASSDAEFAISTELDLLNTAPQLLTIVRAGVYRDIPYELRGSMGVDLPLVRPVQFAASGNIRLTPGGY